MGCQVYQKQNYKIYRAGNNYIVHNSNYPFKEKHTHLRNFNAAKKIISLAISKRIPRDLSDYLLTSLLRISDDENYEHHLSELLEVRTTKGKKLRYVNSH
ncbi:MAG: hypothetical protein N4A76_17040 [Firmicutes bacterium]|jgi:hypothetical protein|nr:hypothetical protein [Bacillota bacterium]